MKQVPLSGRVIFSDWHGVLSRDPFWVSIRGSAAHPLHAQLEAGMAGVFASERGIANEWMKGLAGGPEAFRSPASTVVPASFAAGFPGHHQGCAS